MFDPGIFLRDLRKSRGLSQRSFARISKISFRQLQRVELGESELSWSKFQRVLEKFGYEFEVRLSEPNWDVLQGYGLPLNLSRNQAKPASKSEFIKELCHAAAFVQENKSNVLFSRHYDSVKAVLLGIKIHFPSLFSKIQKGFLPVISRFHLNEISGRDIKLRNIALALLSRELKKTSL